MICSSCNEEIQDGDKTAIGPSGEMHYRCFKRGTAHGSRVDLLSVMDEIGALKKRVQRLEREVNGLDARTVGSIRVGGNS